MADEQHSSGLRVGMVLALLPVFALTTWFITRTGRSVETAAIFEEPPRPDREAGAPRAAAQAKPTKQVPPPEMTEAQRFRQRLAELRAAGGDFAELSPLTAERRAQDAGRANPSTCGDSLQRVVTLETPGGWFVPVSVEAPVVCEWNLWFVPRSRDADPIMFPPRHEEFDLGYTHRMLLADLDADSQLEAVLVLGSEHPEGIGGGTVAALYHRNGRIVATPFEDVRDVNGDGHIDALLRFDSTYNDAGCTADEGEYWSPIDLRGPELLLQREPAGGLSLDTELAKAHRAKECETLGPLSSAVRDNVVNEWELVRLLSCRLANGESRSALRAELSQVCSETYSFPEDCEQRRPGVCVFRTNLMGWIDIFEDVGKYAAKPHRTQHD